MENNNNSKQVVLSIVGIAILVIAVVGVSFAFFTYSRTGEKNNIITTGSITFELTDGSQPAINATDAFPITENEDIATAPSTDFDVTGSLPEGSSPVTYKVYAIQGEDQTGNPQDDISREWDRFDDTEISLGLSYTNAAEEEITIESGYKYDGVSSFGGPINNLQAVDTKDGKSTMGLLLATGTLGAGKTIDHQYTIKMWINNTVTISDTDRSKTYRASDTKKGDSPLPYDGVTPDADNTKNLKQEEESDPREVYSDHYYSIKIMVVASDDPSTFVTP